MAAYRIKVLFSAVHLVVEEPGLVVLSLVLEEDLMVGETFSWAVMKEGWEEEKPASKCKELRLQL